MDLIADHISHSFGALAVLDDVSFEVAAGEGVGIVGPSGWGKSTLLSILGGLLLPTRGAAELRGSPPPGSLNPLTFVFQDFALLPWCTVEGNVAFPLEHAGLSPGERRAVIDDALQRTGLADFRGALERLAGEHGLRFVAPPLWLCTDNAAMIAWAGAERFAAGLTDPLDLPARPRWPLDPDAEKVRGAGVKA